MPFISVVIPVYNVEQYIQRCVTSLVSQDYRDCEIILVDDGSTDRSGIICDDLASAMPQIRVLHKPNGGAASARNYGLQNACGVYVVFVDSDDWVDPDYFSVLDAHLKKNTPDILKFGYRKIHAGKSTGRIVPYYPEGIYNRERVVTDLLPGIVGPVRLFDYSKIPLMSACACAYSRDFLEQNQISFSSEREILNEDFLFNYHAMLCAQRVEVCHSALYLYDYREGSLSKRYVSNMLDRKKKLLGVYKSLLVRYGLYQKFEQAYFGSCANDYYACITNECSQWSEKKTAVPNIKRILKDDDCIWALKKCSHQKIGMKGSIIYWLMRLKMARSIYVLYRLIKGIGSR